MLNSIALSARAYVDPVTAIPRAIDQRRWVVPLLWLMLTGAASAAAWADRLDASKEVIPRMAEAGELAKASEREVNEEIEQAQRITLVLGVGKAIFGMPLAVLAITVLLKLTAWLLGKKALFAACFTTASVAMLPIALSYLLTTVIALRQEVVIPAQAGKLMPSSLQALVPVSKPPVEAKRAEGPAREMKDRKGMRAAASKAVAKGRALAAVDFFNLWAAALLGLGFAAATRISPWRGIALGLFLYVLFGAAILVGLPGLMEGKP